jgi:hypothetical protein
MRKTVHIDEGFPFETELELENMRTRIAVGNKRDTDKNTGKLLTSG